MRLAKEKGLLRGDLNEVQNLALLHYLTEEDRQASAAEWRAFKFNAIAAHPELAKVILELDDPSSGQTQPLLPRPLSDEEISQTAPVTTEDLTGMMDALQGFGIRMS